MTRARILPPPTRPRRVLSAQAGFFAGLRIEKMLRQTRSMVIAVAVLVVALWIHDSRKTREQYEILQVTPAKLSFEVLRERLPVVVHSARGALDVREVVEKGMKYMYAYYSESPPLRRDGAFVDVASRYAVIGARGAGASIALRHGGAAATTEEDPEAAGIVIKVSPASALIVPRNWRFKLMSGAEEGAGFAYAYEVHDTYTAIAQMLMAASSSPDAPFPTAPAPAP